MPTADNGRDPTSGRFLKGNRCSAVPRMTRQKRIAALMDKVATDASVRKVLKALEKAAMNGDVQAMRLYLDHMAGKPAQRVEVESLTPLFDSELERQALLGMADDDADVHAEHPGEDDAAAVDVPPAPAAAGEGGVAADVEPAVQSLDR